MKACIIIQARYDSSRCPGKILRELQQGYSNLCFIHDRIVDLDIPIILATTDRKSDDILAKHAEKNHIKVFRGSHENVASRLYEASEGYDYIVRVTGDDLFVDKQILKDSLSLAIVNKFDYVYQPDLIRGFDCDVFKRSALKEIMDKYDTDKIESIEHYFKGGGFFVGTVSVNEKYTERATGVSLTLDTEEDWTLIKTIYPNTKLELDNIVDYLNNNPSLKMINYIPKVSVYMVHKDYPDFIDQAIDGVLGQDYKNYEFIFVDYGSTSLNSLKPVFKKMDNSNMQFYYKECANFIEAIEYAISKCKGKYVIRADADDIMYRNAISDMLEVAEKNSSAIVIPDYQSYEGENMTTKAGVDLTCHALVEKKKYQFVKYLDGQAYRDGISLLSALRKHKFTIDYLKKPCFFHRVYESSMTEADRQEREEIDTKIYQYECGGLT